MTIKEYLAISTQPNTVLLDIRDSSERKGGRFIEGSINIPMLDILQGVDLQIQKEACIVVLCEKGGRAGIVKEYLLAKGYINTHKLDGGYSEFHRFLERK